MTTTVLNKKNSEVENKIPNASSLLIIEYDCLFGATNVVKISNKEKHVYNGYGITFDSADSWSF